MGFPESDLLQSALRTLYTKYKWKCEFIQDEGTHITMIIFDTNRKRKMKAKISSSIMLTEEIVEWPNLFHPNILPLFNIFQFDQRFNIFLMPCTYTTLAERLHPEHSRTIIGGFLTVKKWLYQSLSALDYLHVRNLRHLNLNLENQLITDRGNLTISDFKHLTCKNKIVKIEEIGMRTVYRPPELCWYEETLIGKQEFEASCLDLWGYGIISLQAITAQMLNLDPNRWHHNSHLSNWRLWKVEVGDILNMVVEKPAYFQHILQKAYPTTKFNKQDIRNCYTFIYSFLREDPKRRLPVELALKHNFLRPYNRKQFETPACQFSLEDKFGKTASLSCLQIIYPILDIKKDKINIKSSKTVKNKGRRSASSPNLGYFTKRNKDTKI